MAETINTRLIIVDGLARIVFDRPDSSANIFDNETLDELDRHIDALEKASNVKTVIVSSAKDNIFIAGADINTLSTATEGEVVAFIDKGQRVFDRLAALPIPTVATIHGTALGGGLEIALACDFRVASDSKSTKLGLPETQLGILPAWGGSTRLAKLVGLPSALDMILKGSTVAPKKAKKIGLVDGLAPRERIDVLAMQLAGKGEPKRKNHWLTNNPVAVPIIKAKVLKDIKSKTRGHYPAQELAVEVICNSVTKDHEESLDNERKAALKLARHDVTRNLMRIFSLTENSKKLRRGDAEPRKIERVCVVGAGVMGAGIAHWLSTRGINVLVQDISAKAIARGIQSMEKLRSNMVKRRLMTKTEAARCRDRIHTTCTPAPLQRYDMVIEAAVENLDIKKKIFADLVTRTRPDTILATNTSALPLTELAEHDGITHPERVVGLHFFNPVHRMKLVEIVFTPSTSDEVCNSCLNLVQKIGKLPVLVKDSPGFVVNRILMPYLIEAGELFEKGVPPEDLDKAMLDFGMPMGPIRLLDEVGLDVSRHVAATMTGAFPSRFSVPKILDDMIAAGQLGKKSGAGFYLHKGKKTSPNPSAMGKQAGSPAEMGRKEITDRLALLMVNEAYRCLEEGVSDDPDAIDMAMIMGAGFAPFRGGPVQYAKDRGLKEIVETLKKFDAASKGDRFSPSAFLMRAAENPDASPVAEAVG